MLVRPLLWTKPDTLRNVAVVPRHIELLHAGTLHMLRRPGECTCTNAQLLLSNSGAARAYISTRASAHCFTKNQAPGTLDADIDLGLLNRTRHLRLEPITRTELTPREATDGRDMWAGRGNNVKGAVQDAPPRLSRPSTPTSCVQSAAQTTMGKKERDVYV